MLLCCMLLNECAVDLRGVHLLKGKYTCEIPEQDFVKVAR